MKWNTYEAAMHLAEGVGARGTTLDREALMWLLNEYHAIAADSWTEESIKYAMATLGEWIETHNEA